MKFFALFLFVAACGTSTEPTDVGSKDIGSDVADVRDSATDSSPDLLQDSRPDSDLDSSDLVADAGDMADLAPRGFGTRYDVVCEPIVNGVATISFDVSPTSSSYHIVPFTPECEDISIISLETPSGFQFDFFDGGENWFQDVMATNHGCMSPITMPATNGLLPRFESGVHTYRLSSVASDEICWYLVEERDDGATIDINLYFVGLEDLDANSSLNDPDFQATVAHLQSIYASAGYTVRIANRIDVPEPDATRYAILQDNDDFESMLATSVVPGATIDDALSVNIFLVRTLLFGIAGSRGIPGAAGLHGTRLSGIAVTTEFLGLMPTSSFGVVVDGNTLTGQIMAHETGHYLGLLHSSEVTGDVHDPISDTPECFGTLDLNCPDVNNLMFPFAEPSHDQLSIGQRFSIGKHPLTK